MDLKYDDLSFGNLCHLTTLRPTHSPEPFNAVLSQDFVAFISTLFGLRKLQGDRQPSVEQCIQTPLILPVLLLKRYLYLI